MRNACITRARALLFPASVCIDSEEDRSRYERFAIPHTFKPQLSLPEARWLPPGLFCGSCWAVCCLLCGAHRACLGRVIIRSPFWRVAVQFPLFLSFIFSLY